MKINTVNKDYAYTQQKNQYSEQVLRVHTTEKYVYIQHKNQYNDQVLCIHTT